MNDFLTLAAQRYSVRKFDTRPIAEDVLQSIVRAGMLAPTACNNQPQRIVLLTGQDALERLKKCTPCHFNCVAAALVCVNTDECWRRGFDGKQSADVDGAIVTTHMMLQAADVGVGSTWVMHFDPAAVRKEFALPDHIQPIALLPMGYPAADAAPAPQHSTCRPQEELVLRDTF